MLDQATLAEHMQTHMDTSLDCEKCDAKLPDQAALDLHMQTHTGGDQDSQMLKNIQDATERAIQVMDALTLREQEMQAAHEQRRRELLQQEQRTLRQTSERLQLMLDSITAREKEIESELQ